MKNMLFDLSNQPELQPEADEQGRRLLAQQSRLQTGLALRMIAGLCEGLRQPKRPTE
jgi:hypothetical protein